MTAQVAVLTPSGVWALGCSMSSSVQSEHNYEKKPPVVRQNAICKVEEDMTAIYS